MSEEKTIIVPDSGQNNNGWGGLPVSIPLTGLGFNNGYGYGNGGGFFGGSGFGAGILGGLLGGLIWGGLGRGWGNGWGNGYGGDGAAAALGAQATAIGNTDSILRAIDGSDSDIRLLATTLNSDVNTVKSNLSTIQNGLTQLAGQTGLSAQQIVNAIQQGDASLASQLCQCCCQMQLLTTEQGYQAQIRTIEQTNQLGSQADRNTAAITGAIADFRREVTQEFCDVKEREMQEKINTLTANNTLLRSQIDNAAQTAQIAGLIAPLAQEVNDIKCKLPNTVPVTYPNITAVNNTPNMGGYYGGGFYGGFPGFWGGGFGNGFGGNIVF